MDQSDMDAIILIELRDFHVLSRHHNPLPSKEGNLAIEL
jgi:hypothetical protein